MRKFYTMCTLIDFLTIIILYFVFFFPKWKKNRFELFNKTCLYIYGVGVLYVTGILPLFIPIPFINVDISRLHANLIPFIDYMYLRGDFMRQILLNILMLIPFGILYPFIYKRDLKRTMLTGILLSISIELFQLISVRQLSSCDITDVITNTIGVFIGYIIFKVLGKPVKQLLIKLFPDKERKTYSVSKRTKTVVVAIIVIQLLIRSIRIMFG